MKIDLPIIEYTGWRVVQAELVDVAPHLPATFAVHETPWPEYRPWSVSNVETGALITRAESKQRAIDKAQEMLVEKSARQYNIAVQEICRKYRQCAEKLRPMKRAGK